MSKYQLLVKIALSLLFFTDDVAILWGGYEQGKSKEGKRSLRDDLLPKGTKCKLKTTKNMGFPHELFPNGKETLPNINCLCIAQNPPTVRVFFASNFRMG